MGWHINTDKPEQSNNSEATRRNRSRSMVITGSEIEQIILQRQYSNTERTTVERNGLQTTQQRTTCTIIGQILRIVGDELDNVTKDNYEITNYGRV